MVSKKNLEIVNAILKEDGIIDEFTEDESGVIFLGYNEEGLLEVGISEIEDYKILVTSENLEDVIDSFVALVRQECQESFTRFLTERYDYQFPRLFEEDT